MERFYLVDEPAPQGCLDPSNDVVCLAGCLTGFCEVQNSHRSDIA